MPSEEGQTFERSFDVDGTVAIPTDTHLVSCDGGAVAISPSTGRWMIFRRSESISFFRHLQGGATVGVAAALVAQQVGECAAQAAVEEVLGEVLDKGFGDAENDADADLDPYDTITLTITNQCNLRCVTCYKFSGERLPNELPPEFWKRCIIDFSRLGGKYLRISGGEPLCGGRESLVRSLVSAAKQYRLKVLLLTNGVLVDQSLADALIKSGIDRIQVSLDGPNPEVNDRIRGKGVFDKVLRTLDMFRGSSVELFVAMLPVPALSVDALASEGTAFAKNLKRRFGDQISISVSHGMLPGRGVSGEHNLAFIQECRKLQNTVAGPCTASALDLWQWEPGRKNWSCGYARQLSIEPDGAVRPCTAGEVVANARETPLAVLVSKLRSLAVGHHVDKLNGCNDCLLRYVCGGPCRVKPQPCTQELQHDLLGRLVSSNTLRYKLLHSD